METWGSSCKGKTTEVMLEKELERPLKIEKWKLVDWNQERIKTKSRTSPVFQRMEKTNKTKPKTPQCSVVLFLLEIFHPYFIFFQKRSSAGVVGPVLPYKVGSMLLFIFLRPCRHQGLLLLHYFCLVKWDCLQSNYKHFVIFICQLKRKKKKRLIFLICIGLGLFCRSISRNNSF